jgi:hypothetical protein
MLCAGVILMAALAALTSTASAAGGLSLCVPKHEGSAVLTPRHGKCKHGFKLTALGAEGHEGRAGKEGKSGSEGKPRGEGKAGSAGFSPAELEVLKGLLGHIRVVAAGIDGKPTVQFSGVNVQIVNGEGTTESANGEGNLVIGYDESPGPQSGSHNLILGVSQTFSSFGSILAGAENAATGPFASVTGGAQNHAEALASSVAGGKGNEIPKTGFWAAIGGGLKNLANSEESTVSGGGENEAVNFVASVNGGHKNLASGFYGRHRRCQQPGHRLVRSRQRRTEQPRQRRHRVSERRRLQHRGR